MFHFVSIIVDVQTNIQKKKPHNLTAEWTKQTIYFDCMQTNVSRFPQCIFRLYFLEDFFFNWLLLVLRLYMVAYCDTVEPHSTKLHQWISV